MSVQTSAISPIVGENEGARNPSFDRARTRYGPNAPGAFLPRLNSDGQANNSTMQRNTFYEVPANTTPAGASESPSYVMARAYDFLPQRVDSDEPTGNDSLAFETYGEYQSRLDKLMNEYRNIYSDWRRHDVYIEGVLPRLVQSAGRQDILNVVYYRNQIGERVWNHAGRWQWMYERLRRKRGADWKESRKAFEAKFKTHVQTLLQLVEQSERIQIFPLRARLETDASSPLYTPTLPRSAIAYRSYLLGNMDGPKAQYRVALTVPPPLY